MKAVSDPVFSSAGEGFLGNFVGFGIELLSRKRLLRGIFCQSGQRLRCVLGLPVRTAANMRLRFALLFLRGTVHTWG